MGRTLSPLPPTGSLAVRALGRGADARVAATLPARGTAGLFTIARSGRHAD